MPVYLYRNLTTGETFELEQRITEAALTHHPDTGEPVKRLVQPVGIAFKGSGFYATDSRQSAAKAKGETKPEGSAQSEGKSETAGKPESKAEPKAEPKADKKPASATPSS